MIQTATASEQIVDEIVATLIARFNPRLIYLFGSRARGDARPDSDYDFLIEIERTPESSEVRKESRNSLTDFPAADVQLHVRYPDELERRKDDPGVIDWDVIREGKLLWASPSARPIIPAPTGGRVREPDRTPPRSLGDWLARADRDLRVSLHLSANAAEWPNEICFHCQQSGEKFLRALIIAQHERPARTHNLDELLGQLLALGFSLGEIRSDCVLLSKFAVQTRYPDDEKYARVAEEIPMPEPIVFSEQDAREAIAALNRIVAAVRLQLPLL
ncbi:MAG: HEPN domain-containing protein [Gemmatimonadaceae bacterium]